jgi:hypothetical protein
LELVVSVLENLRYWARLPAQIWTHENHAEIIYSNKFIDQKINYIHENPVRAEIVEHPEDYLYSSARNYADLQGVLDVIPVQFSVERIKLMRNLR